MSRSSTNASRLRVTSATGGHVRMRGGATLVTAPLVGRAGTANDSSCAQQVSGTAVNKQIHVACIASHYNSNR